MIISSECLIWTVVKLIILVRMAYIIDRLVSRCARSIVTFYIGLHEVCVRVGRRTYIITKFLGWIGYRTLLPIRALKRAGSSDLAVMQGSGHYRDNWR